MAGISLVFTIARVAEKLGEDEDWLHELSMGLDPEDGCLWIYDIDDREVQAFTPYGMSPGDEYSPFVGNENSLVGLLA